MVVYANFASAPVELSLPSAIPSTPREEFFLTAPGGNLVADSLLLNGAPDGDGKIGLPIAGKVVGQGPINLPGESYGFVLLSAAAARACM